ncbi:MAG: DUF4419 domain-containing protein [Minicystis sp.]
MEDPSAGPYDDPKWIERLAPNRYLSRWESAWRAAEARTGWLMWGDSQGPALRAIPSGLASAPVKLVDHEGGVEHTLRFVAGMLGVVQDAGTLALAPEFGWAVVHDG